MQVVPVYPKSHVHCDDKQSVLGNKSVHSEGDVHTIPTTSEKIKGESCFMVVEANNTYIFKKVLFILTSDCLKCIDANKGLDY